MRLTDLVKWREWKSGTAAECVWARGRAGWREISRAESYTARVLFYKPAPASEWLFFMCICKRKWTISMLTIVSRSISRLKKYWYISNIDISPSPRLETVLTKVLKRGGLSANEADRHLLRQFCRGCWENVLIADLQLERKRDNPSCQRMKKHLEVSKQKATVATSLQQTLLKMTHQQIVTSLSWESKSLSYSQLTRQKAKKVQSNASSWDNEVAELKKKVSELKSQLTSRKTQNPTKTRPM